LLLPAVRTSNQGACVSETAAPAETLATMHLEEEGAARGSQSSGTQCHTNH